MIRDVHKIFTQLVGVFQTTTFSFIKNFPSKWILLVCLVIGLSFWLRFFDLAQKPPVLNPDEASIAYNAFLLAKTGLDEWQEPYPFILQAFGDQKIGGYTYIVVAQFVLFGISQWAVRAPAALAGVLTIVLTGFLFFRLRHNISTKNRFGFSLIAMSLIAIQPVFIWFSRSAFEASVSLACMLGAIALSFGNSGGKSSLSAPNSKCSLSSDSGLSAMVISKNLLTLFRLFLFALLLMIAIFMYNAPLVWLPFLFAPLPVWIGIKKWRVWLPYVILAAVIWASSLLILQGLTTQKSKITLFGDPHVLYEQQQYYLQFENPTQRTLFGNKYVFYSRRIATNLYESLAPQYVVQNLDGHSWHVFPRTGYLTGPVYLLGWIGLFSLASRWYTFSSHTKNIFKVLKKYRADFLMLYLTTTSLIPALITVNAPHATRTLFFFLGWIYFATHGIAYVVRIGSVVPSWIVHSMFRVSTSKVRTALYYLTTILMAGSIAIPSATYAYTVLLAPIPLSEWGGGVRAGFPEIITKAEVLYPGKVVENEQENQSDQAIQPRITIVDPQGFLYITLAWYQQLEPSDFWNQVHREPPDTINFSYGSRLGRYDFVPSYEMAKDRTPVIYWNDGWQLKTE